VQTIGLRYLESFQCIGAECEDDCCSGWAVPVDEKHFHAIEQALAGTDELARSLRVDPDPKTRRHALMILDDERHCAMLGQDKLCKLQARFGETVLPDACAIFPRAAAAVGNHFELSASLSCPEIARRCLLVDGATEMVELPKESVVRGILFRVLRGDEGVYQASFEAVRGLVMGLLSQRRVPIATRLCAVAWFAEQTRPWLHEKAESADREALGRLFLMLRQPEALERFQEQISSARFDEPFPASVVLQVMLAAREDPAPLFAELIERALASDAADPVKIFAAHRRRAGELPREALAVQELALEAFAKNAAFKEWYLLMPSFSRWTQALMIRVAVIRYLFAAHPLVKADPAGAMVEVVYSMSRTFDHGDRSIRKMIDELEAQRMVTLGHALSLVTF
jgi:lysine-N-methylase